MADDPSVEIRPGVQVPVAADEIGGVQYQRVKVQVGADGSAADVHAGNGMPVTPATGASFAIAAASLPLPSGASTNAKLDEVLTALADLQSELAQKLEAGQEVALNSATLAALESISAAISNWPSDYPDASVLAKLEAIRSLIAGTLTITGSVSVGSSALPSGAATSANQAAANGSLSSIDGKTPSLSLGFSPVYGPTPHGSRSNIVPAEFSGWTVGGDTTLSTNSTGSAPIPGVTSWTRASYANASGQGIYVQRGLAGRTDGAAFLFSFWARTDPADTNARTLNIQLRTDDGAQQEFSYPTITVPANGVWTRFVVRIQVNLASCTNLLIRMYASPTLTHVFDFYGAQLEQSESGTPSEYQPAVSSPSTPVVAPVPRISVVGWGDSLWNGAGGFSPRPELSRRLNGATILDKGVGGETSTQIKDRMIADAVSNKYGVVILEAGRNNMASVSTVLADIAEMIAAMQHARWLLLEVWNSTSEPQGSATYSAMVQINESLAARYGSRLVRWRHRLVSGTPTDIPRAELMFDATHPNAAGHGMIAEAIYAAMHANGFLPVPFGSQRAPEVGAADVDASQPVSLPTDKVILSSATQTVLNTDLLTESVSGWMDASAFHSASIQVIGSAGISAGAVFFEQTNDIANASAGVAWPMHEAALLNANPQIAAITIAANTARIFEGAVMSKYVRVRISTAFTGGTVRVAAVLSQLPYAANRLNIQQATAASLNATIAALPTGGNTIGNVGIVASSALGSSTTHKLISAASTNATSVKASAGTINVLTISNNGGAVAYFKLYNKASAPTVGTDATVSVVLVPAGQTLAVPCGIGMRLATGIAYALTTGIADADTGAVAANQIAVSMSYT